jgi:hypothetical protein
MAKSEMQRMTHFPSIGLSLRNGFVRAGLSTFKNLFTFSKPLQPSPTPQGQSSLDAALRLKSYKTATDFEIITSACQSFGIFAPHIDLNNQLPAKPQNNFTRLPVEVQLMALDKLPLYEADRLIRTNYPHLIQHWIRAIPRRVMKWFDDLCSRENLRYIGNHAQARPEYPGISEIWRCKSLDMHRNLILPGSCVKGEEFEWKVIGGNKTKSANENQDILKESDEDLYDCPSFNSAKSWQILVFTALLNTFLSSHSDQRYRFIRTLQDWNEGCREQCE